MVGRDTNVSTGTDGQIGFIHMLNVLCEVLKWTVL